MSLIRFFSQDIDFKLPHPRKTASWLKKVIGKEGFTVNGLNFIFCSDEHLLQINQQYLGHDTYTDIVTFNNSETDGALEGDVFISIDRVRDNADQLKIGFEDELDRVIVHGVLHLIGYSDKSPALAREMRKKEDASLSLR